MQGLPCRHHHNDSGHETTLRTGDGVAEPGIRTGVKSLQTSHDAHETITAL